MANGEWRTVNGDVVDPSFDIVMLYVTSTKKYQQYCLTIFIVVPLNVLCSYICSSQSHNIIFCISCMLCVHIISYDRNWIFDLAEGKVHILCRMIRIRFWLHSVASSFRNSTSSLNQMCVCWMCTLYTYYLHVNRKRTLQPCEICFEWISCWRL